MSRALVTGASGGIGEAVARRLRDAGYEVIVAARRIDRLQELAGQIGATACELDVTSAGSVSRIADQLGDLDVLVNNAGGALGADPVVAGAVDDWQAMYDVNVLGTLRLTSALMGALRSGQGGSVVNITSTAAFVNYEGGAGYSAAKHAEHALTETLRLELCGEPVRVIEVAPGMVRSESFALTRFRGDREQADAVYQDVDRPLVPEDVAECVAFAVALPQHVNIDQLVVRPLAQAAQHKVHRGALFH